jgi:hypothetical protein
MTNSTQPTIVFADPDNAVMPSVAIIHENDPFQVQWAAHNTAEVTSTAFSDLLVITSIPEGCPGSDDQEHPVVFSSKTDGDPSEYQEQPLGPGATGNLMQPTVGPFPAGSYWLTVTLASNVGNGDTTFNCIDIIPASGNN